MLHKIDAIYVKRNDPNVKKYITYDMKMFWNCVTLAGDARAGCSCVVTNLLK